MLWETFAVIVLALALSGIFAAVKWRQAKIAAEDARRWGQRKVVYVSFTKINFHQGPLPTPADLSHMISMEADGVPWNMEIYLGTDANDGGKYNSKFMYDVTSGYVFIDWRMEGKVSVIKPDRLRNLLKEYNYQIRFFAGDVLRLVYPQVVKLKRGMIWLLDDATGHAAYIADVGTERIRSGAIAERIHRGWNVSLTTVSGNTLIVEVPLESRRLTEMFIEEACRTVKRD